MVDGGAQIRERLRGQAPRKHALVPRKRLPPLPRVPPSSEAGELGDARAGRQGLNACTGQVADSGASHHPDRLGANRRGPGPRNLSTWIIGRQLALGLLKQRTDKKVGIKNRCLVAEWDHDFLLRVIGLDV